MLMSVECVIEMDEVQIDISFHPVTFTETFLKNLGSRLAIFWDIIRYKLSFLSQSKARR